MGKIFNMPLVVNRDGEIYSPQGVIAHADSKRELEKLNALGADQTITTLTSILPDVIKQKYYTIPLADYVDIEVGQGNPFAAKLFNWQTEVKDGGFESGFIELGSNRSNAQEDDIAVSPREYAVASWKKDVTYNIFEEGVFSAGTQNMDYVREKYDARKTAYDLGIQEFMCVGSKQQPAKYNGLLTVANATSNTSVITKNLSSMTAAEFNAVLAGLMPAYATATSYTVMPNRLVIPADDYMGLASFMAETFPYPGSTRLEVLENALKMITKRADFKVLPLVYASKDNNAGITDLNKNRYALYNKDAKSLIARMPIDFTLTLPGTVNGFDYTSAAYSRFTGVQGLRNEMVYFDFT